MAVSFKIPKSPKRDVFVVNEFKGVDYTNVGTEVDPTRSPNAPNMIRHVPGKVRKRMGYEKRFFIGKKNNVNFAKGASIKEKEYKFTESNIGQYIDLYDLTVGLTDPYYIEFDYKSEKEFVMTGCGTIPASEEWTHFSYESSPSPGTLVAISIKSYEVQEIYIKNFAAMQVKDDAYKWSQAPVAFIEEPTTAPVNGCHIFSTTDRNSNNVVNVNRALNTSSTFTTISVDRGVTTTIATLADFVWTDGTNNTKVVVDFDYVLEPRSETLHVDLLGTRIGDISPATSGNFEHFHMECEVGSLTEKDMTVVYAEGGPIEYLSYKNLSVCYKTDEHYAWSKAPEDTGGVFNSDEIYNHSRKNYAKSTSYYNTGNTEPYQRLDDIHLKEWTDSDASDVIGFTRLSFNLSATASRTSSFYLTIYTHSLIDDRYGTIYTKRFLHTNSLNRKFELILATEAPWIVTSFTLLTDIDGTQEALVTTKVENIVFQTIRPKYNFERASKYYFYHVGNNLYCGSENDTGLTKLYSSMANNRSSSLQLDEMLLIMDGNDIYTYKKGEFDVSPIGSSDAYIPLVTISKSPSGGGTSYESLNMIQPGFYEQFYCGSSQSSATQFQLSFFPLDSTTTKAWVLQANGTWAEKTEGTHYSVNRATGKITFTTAPGTSPITGEDNVKILAYRTVSGYREKIAHCTFGTLFGVGGASDRVFLSGNPDYPNQDFYSGLRDATYFPDTGYSSLGSISGAITGYARVNNYLATFKEEKESAQNVIIRSGDLVTRTITAGDREVEISEPAFKIINALQGEGAITPFSFGYLQTEPVFLTKLGVMAITAQDITGEKYSQNRSFYLNEKLLKEENLSNAVATIYKDMYILAINNHLYILDGLQPVRTDKSEPYATRQYSSFYCDDIPATCLWTDSKSLCFGTEDGKICRFYTDEKDRNSYNDDGYPISAWWETPDLDGNLFYKNKTFRYLALRMMQAIRTSCKIYSMKMGSWTFIKEDTSASTGYDLNTIMLNNWTFIKEDRSAGTVFDFDDIDFEWFSFNTDTSEKVVHTKLRVKKVDKARFKVENSELNEPFGLYDLALEYIESGNYKR